MDDTLDFSLIEKAGLSQGEFADLCNVSRITVNLWVNGRMKPHRYLHAGVKQALEEVQTAIDEKRLPIPGVTTRGQRRRDAVQAALFPVTA
jgi:transcriptional regulator with XRE-family HTH domain